MVLPQTFSNAIIHYPVIFLHFASYTFVSRLGWRHIARLNYGCIRRTVAGWGKYVCREFHTIISCAQIFFLFVLVVAFIHLLRFSLWFFSQFHVALIFLLYVLLRLTPVGCTRRVCANEKKKRCVINIVRYTAPVLCVLNVLSSEYVCNSVCL